MTKPPGWPFDGRNPSSISQSFAGGEHGGGSRLAVVVHKSGRVPTRAGSRAGDRGAESIEQRPPDLGEDGLGEILVPQPTNPLRGPIHRRRVLLRNEAWVTGRLTSPPPKLSLYNTNEHKKTNMNIYDIGGIGGDCTGATGD